MDFVSNSVKNMREKRSMCLNKLFVCFGYKPRSFAAINKPKKNLKNPTALL